MSERTLPVKILECIHNYDQERSVSQRSFSDLSHACIKNYKTQTHHFQLSHMVILFWYPCKSLRHLGQLLTHQTTQSTGTGTIQKLTNITGSSLELTLPSKVSMKAEKLLYQPQRFSTITLCGYLAEKQHAMLYFFLHIKDQI